MKPLFTLLLLLSALTARADSYVGYTNCNVQRTQGVHLSSTSRQGLAVCIPAAKAAALAGGQLVGVRFACGSSQCTDYRIFASHDLSGAPIAEQSISGVRSSMTDFLFDAPIDITADDLYVGYSCIDDAGRKTALFDLSIDLPAGLSWGWDGEAWTDLSGCNYGAPNIQLIVSGDVAPFADVVVKPFTTEAYVKAGEPFSVVGQVFNFGAQPVTALALTYAVGGEDPVTTVVCDLNIAQGETYDVILPSVTAAESGRFDLSLSAEALDADGLPVADADANDNLQRTSRCIYPADMRRRVLVEEFTGQDCSNCPAAVTALHAVLSVCPDECTLVAHHAGYFPDIFTNTDDVAYTWFYASSSTYAPAAMVNRCAYLSAASSPVFSVSGEAPVITSLAAALIEPPYVAVDLANAFDPASSTGELTVRLRTYDEPSDAQHTLNVWLIQDGIVGYQSAGGSGYVHNDVFRLSLTGVWGEPVVLQPGADVVRTFAYTLPASITPTSPSTSIALPTDAASMRFVVFVGDVTDSALTCRVWNADEVALTESREIDGVHGVSCSSMGKPTADVPLYDLAGRRAGASARGVLITADGRKILR